MLHLLHLRMHCYICSVEAGELVLTEHEAARWLDLESIWSVDWLPADVDVVKQLVERGKLSKAKGVWYNQITRNPET